jgi:hypothetical protein
MKNAVMGLMLGAAALSFAACAVPTDDIAEPISESAEEAKGGIKGKPSKCNYNDPNRSYVSKDPEQCATIKFFCESGEGFSDACGCGCLEAPASEPCGNTTCGAGEYCCNESCGICAPEGGFCIQLFCG